MKRGKGNHPELAEEEKGKDGEYQDEGGKDAFHGSLFRIRGVRGGGCLGAQGEVLAAAESEIVENSS